MRREAHGAIHWETSSDGLTWQDLVSVPNPIPTKAVDIAFGIIAVGGVAPGDAVFRNDNVPPR